MASWLHARQWLFSLKAFMAAMLALYIALYFGLSRPYWAMATVYFVSNPLSGATRSKAAYRVAGTVLGAAAAVITVPLLVNMPIVMMAVIALWIALLVYLSALQRGPRGYVFLLAAYTLPIVALPTVTHPTDIFDIAVARIEEIVVGIACAALVGSIIFPAKIAPALREKVRIWLDDAATWAADIASDSPRSGVSRHRMAADMLALDHMIEQLSFDSESRRTVGRARRLRARMGRVIPVLSGLDSVLQAMRTGTPSISPQQSLVETVGYLQTQYDILMSGCADLLEYIGESATRVPDRVTDASESNEAAALHHDHFMLLIGSLSAGLSVFLIGLLWILSGWEDGGGPVAIAAVAGCLFATIDEPRLHIRSFVRWSVGCLAISSFYLFLVVPHAHNFETLVGMLALPYLGIGLLMGRPGFNLVAILLSVNTASFANVQSLYDTNFIGVFNTNLANAAATLSAPICAMLARPFGAHVAAQRLIHASWGDLALAATRRAADVHSRLGARMLDRLGQLTPRLGASRGRIASDGFTELQVGYCTLALQQVLPELPTNGRKSVRRVLSIVARHYRAQSRSGRVVAVPPRLLAAVEASIAQISLMHDRDLVAGVQSALVVLAITLHAHEKYD
ncbi:FUSC family protein [Cupriavidus sp. 2SB]|uniref:FUSC family protein n=1 Tax=Cupriavidus sp. 2SB TaxID=2502199 RepID=UPI0010F7AB86|nr:FUSC family protein [Cupriavidus sp. 2SB]